MTFILDSFQVLSSATVSFLKLSLLWRLFPEIWKFFNLLKFLSPKFLTVCIFLYIQYVHIFGGIQLLRHFCSSKCECMRTGGDGGSYLCKHLQITFFNWAPSPGTTYNNYHIICQKTEASCLNLSKNLLNLNLNS